MAISRVLVSMLVATPFLFHVACSEQKSSQGATPAPAKVDKNKAQEDEDEDQSGSKTQKGGTQSGNATASDSDGPLALLVGTWVGSCEEEQSDDMPPQVFYQVETKTFKADGSYQEEEEYFSDANCSTPRPGGAKKVVDVGNSVKIMNSVSDDTVFISWKRVSKFDDQTGKLEPKPEDLSALIQVKDDQMKVEKATSAAASFTEKAESFTKK